MAEAASSYVRHLVGSSGLLATGRAGVSLHVAPERLAGRVNRAWLNPRGLDWALLVVLRATGTGGVSRAVTALALTGSSSRNPTTRGARGDGRQAASFIALTRSRALTLAGGACRECRAGRGTVPALLTAIRVRRRELRRIGIEHHVRRKLVAGRLHGPLHCRLRQARIEAASGTLLYKTRLALVAVADWLSSTRSRVALATLTIRSRNTAADALVRVDCAYAGSSGLGARATVSLDTWVGLGIRAGRGVGWARRHRAGAPVHCARRHSACALCGSTLRHLAAIDAERQLRELGATTVHDRVRDAGPRH